MFKKSLGNILLLSIPGVILGSLLFGFVFKVILAYEDIDMNWMQAITLGCAMTSTDPVALVALLKDFGSTSKFNTLLEGESLISGAFSMIFYYVLLDVTNGNITNVFEFTVTSVRLTAGGICVGLLFGFIVSTWMKRIVKDHTLSIVITIIGSYLSFYLCEFTWLKFGGVAAVVIQGLYLATVVKRKIYHES
jgi:NhaP-type Na+/H+ or K+/H+ antiporter